MNEHELKSALRDVMVASSPPPSMDAHAAVRAGQRAHRRRRATWGGGVAASAVVGIAVGAVYVPTLTGGGSQQVAGPPVATAPLTTNPTVPPSDQQTKPQWPNGQTDRTATNGPRADKSVEVLNDLGAALPAGFRTAELKATDPNFAGPMRFTQSQFRDYYNGSSEIWDYQATSPVTRTDGSPGAGRIHAQITTKGNDFSTDPCELTTRSCGVEGACSVIDVAGKPVGVLTASGASADPRFDELAAYRHDDGTVVFIAQSKEYYGTGHPRLDAEPLTIQQLAALATDPRFHLE
jgi:hypothetical protein